MNSARQSIVVLLLNLGGPESLGEVRPFLYRLFDDPEIIRIRFSPLRKLMAWSISTARSRTSQSMYRHMGGRSPIRALSQAQADALIRELGHEWPGIQVKIAFSASQPLIEHVVEACAKEGITQFILLPMFPQFSYTSSKSVLDRARMAIGRAAPGASIVTIPSFHRNSHFIQAHADLIACHLPKGEETAGTHILFSAHSIPEKLVTRLGDPYRDQVLESASDIIQRLHWKGPWSVSWQSKLGPVKWLEPATMDEVKRMGASGVRNLLVVPIAFVTEHLETLYELDHLIANEAQRSGIKNFIRIPALNAHPGFIDALRDLVRQRTPIHLNCGTRP